LNFFVFVSKIDSNISIQKKKLIRFNSFAINTTTPLRNYENLYPAININTHESLVARRYKDYLDDNDKGGITELAILEHFQGNKYFPKLHASFEERNSLLAKKMERKKKQEKKSSSTHGFLISSLSFSSSFSCQNKAKFFLFFFFFFFMQHEVLWYSL